MNNQFNSRQNNFTIHSQHQNNTDNSINNQYLDDKVKRSRFEVLVDEKNCVNFFPAKTWLVNCADRYYTYKNNRSSILTSDLNKKNERKQSVIGAGIGIGVGVGVAIGVAMGNIVVGIAIGVSIGAGVGVGMQKKKNA